MESNNQYYKLPIKFDAVFNENGKGMDTCDEINSIDQYIELLLTTCPGEHLFNKNFGCRIWDMDFERVVSRKKWEDDFTGYILETIQNFEKRLTDVSVNISIKDVARHNYAMQTTAVKKEVMVFIKANLLSNNEPCEFYYSLFLGPLSTE